MAAVVITPTVAADKQPTALVSGTLVAADSSNGNYFVYTGREILVAINLGAATQTLAVTGQPHPVTGVTGGISATNIDADSVAILPPLAQAGWVDSAGNVNVMANSSDVKLLLIRFWDENS